MGGDKGGKGGKGGSCDTSLSQTDCAAQGCTYYDGYGCYGRKKTGGNGKGGKGDAGGKGDKGGKGGGRCQRSSSQSDCDADYCTYYEGYGCYRTKNNSGKGGKGDMEEKVTKEVREKEARAKDATSNGLRDDAITTPAAPTTTGSAVSATNQATMEMEKSLLCTDATFDASQLLLRMHSHYPSFFSPTEKLSA